MRVELTVEVRQVVGDEALAERAQRFEHERHGDGLSAASEGVALVENLATLCDLLAVAPEVGRNVAGRLGWRWCAVSCNMGLRSNMLMSL